MTFLRGEQNLFKTLLVRVGHLRLNVTFSDSLPFDLTCLMHAEFPSAMFLNKQGSLTGTYM